ncbi:unnamed protein product [Nesidiocoris tenuis]|uniref:Uncharacterized protein n=1 Tax=Nesidiocoris tenuis TaxID=355587 RepID=A0A6H5HP81_9HEMI|nr:unnamed protein product [Nesidiocoris tenuis]
MRSARFGRQHPINDTTHQTARTKFQKALHCACVGHMPTLKPLEQAKCKFVEEAHFGGGMLKKAEGSRMAVIDQLIADSKMRKAEKAANKEQTLAATEQLDQEWKDLLPVLGAGKPADSEDTKKDDYDKILGSLRFEPRGTPSDRLQSESEVAEKEAKRLRELEEERLRRMTGEAGPESNEASNKSQNHRSADDLDDGHSKRDIEDEDGEENEEDDDDDSEENSDEETDDDFSDLKLTCDDDENDDNDDVGGPDLISSSTVGSKRKAAGSADDSDNDETTTSTKKKTLSPTQEEQVLADGPSGEEKAENQIQDRPDGSKKAKKVSFSSDVNLVNYESEGPAVKSLEELETIKKDKEHLLMEAARTELPYTFLVPGEYEEFEELLKDRSLAQQAVILERMIKCTHPSLKEGNKGKLETLFTFVLQKLNDDEYSTVWSSLETFAPYLFDLTQFSPKHAAEAVNDVLAEKFSDYLKKKTHYPYPDTYVSLSKRIAPEAITFLVGIFRMASHKLGAKESQIAGPFLPEYKFLNFSEDLSNMFDKNKIKDERIRMKRRVKKETKGALREIRKDRTFIDGVRFREQKASPNRAGPIYSHAAILGKHSVMNLRLKDKEQETPEVLIAKRLELEGVNAAEGGDFEKAENLFSQAIGAAGRASSYNNRAQLLRLKGNDEGNMMRKQGFLCIERVYDSSRCRMTHMVERPEGSEESNVFGQVREKPQMVGSQCQQPNQAENFESYNSEGDDEDQKSSGGYAQVVDTHSGN